MKLIGNEEWTDLLTHYRYEFYFKKNEIIFFASQYSDRDLKHVVNLLAKALYQIEYTKKGQKFNAVKKKYTMPKVSYFCWIDKLL